jgi:hypothetical protein
MEGGMMKLTVNGRPIDYSDLPEHMQGGMQRYMEHGIEPGSFLVAVLSNDLMGAFGKADHINAQFIREYCQWLYNHAPAGSFGSRERVNAWMKHRVDEAA